LLKLSCSAYTTAMDTAAQTLVIINSIVLVIFLIVFIITLVYVIKVLKQLGRITEHAEHVAESVEAAANTFEKAASPMALLTLLGKIVEQTNKFRKKKG
jgi:beta-lactamase regulating signal transducer with metallopeptidase domain